MKVTISLTLDPKEDADIIRWLERQRPRGRATAMRQAIRAGWSSGNSGGLERKIDEILRRLEAGVVTSGEQRSGSEPEQAASALDKLGL